MASFAPAIVFVLENEKGYINHKYDPGGKTKFGISLRFLKGIGLYGDFNKDGLVNGKDISELSIENAIKIYRKFWWDKYLYKKINNQANANKIFDSSINIGSFYTHRMLQESINRCYKIKGEQGNVLLVDGILGSHTFRMLNQNQYQKKIESLFIMNLCKYYIGLYDADPNKRSEFIKGWLTRATRRS